MRIPARPIVLIAATVLLTAGCGPPNYVAIGEDMAPAIERGDIVAIDMSAYAERSPQVGEMVAYHAPDDQGGRMRMGRVVAFGGHNVAVEDGTLYLNGEPIEETFVVEPMSYHVERLEVPLRHVYILGDNRNEASDSHRFGPVPVDAVIGRIIDVQKPPGSDVLQ